MVGESDAAAHHSRASRATFVVRIVTSDGSERVCGDVQHLRSRQRVQFDSRDHLLSFIQDHLDHVTDSHAETDR